MAVPNLADQLGVEELSAGEYVSKSLPGSFGNVRGIAYGGCTTAVATSAAFATVPEGYFLYSLVGHFLGPATTTAKLYCTVHKTRDTKTFTTRRVVVKQEQSDGKIRTCLEVLADFHVEEPALLTYSAPPTLRYKGPDETPTLKELVGRARSAGHIKDDPIAKHAPMFYASETYWEMRTCTEGMSGQNLVGMLAKQMPTDQDDLPLTDRVSADWVKSKVALASVGERTAAVVFLMDGGVPFVALTHSHLWYNESGPCNTLDFALRLFVPVVDLNEWHLRERKTIMAGRGRSYNEARIFDEQGNLSASMTQQCILRPKAKADTKAAL